MTTLTNVQRTRAAPFESKEYMQRGNVEMASDAQTRIVQDCEYLERQIEQARTKISSLQSDRSNLDMNPVLRRLAELEEQDLTDKIKTMKASLEVALQARQRAKQTGN